MSGTNTVADGKKNIQARERQVAIIFLGGGRDIFPKLTSGGWKHTREARAYAFVPTLLMAHSPMNISKNGFTFFAALLFLYGTSVAHIEGHILTS